MNAVKRIFEKLKRNNQHIVDYLDAYRRMGNVDFAVMITGPWGSGKTEFVKSWTDSLKRIDNDDQPDYLSVSLNGVLSLNDIDSLLFRAAHPVLGGKSARFAGKVLGAIASGIKLTAGGSDSKVSGEFMVSELKGFSFDKWIGDAPLLVFDDLERCCIDIESLMGYFDDLLKNGKKLVLICAEDEIKRRWKDNAQNKDGRTLPSYVEICSKVVGKRFYVEAEIEDLYGVLVAQAECSNALGEFLTRRKGGFVDLFNAVGTWAQGSPESHRRVHNYRAFKHALRGLAYWYGKLPSEARKNEDFLLDFSRAFVLIDYALLSGALRQELVFQSGESLDSQSPFEKLMEAGDVAWYAWDAPDHDVGVPAAMMKRMVFNEPIDKDELAQGVRQSKHLVKAIQRTEWQQLLQWNLLEDEQVSSLTDCVMKKIVNMEYVVAEEILHIFSLLGEMAAYGMLAKSLDAVVQDCKAYVEKVVACGKFKAPAYDKNELYRLSDRGLGFRYSGSFDNKAYFSAVYEIVLAAIHEIDAKQQESDISDMIPELSRYPSKFYVALQDGSHRWSREPVLDRIDVEVFYKAYCSLSNADKDSVGRILYSRAGRDSLSSERDFLRRLIDMLTNDVETCGEKSLSPSIFQKKILAEHLRKRVGVVER